MGDPEVEIPSGRGWSRGARWTVTIAISFALFWIVKLAIDGRFPWLDFFPPPTLHSVEPIEISAAGAIVNGTFRLVEDPGGLAADKHNGGACVVFSPTTQKTCTLDADCGSLDAVFSKGVNECGGGICWRKLDEANCLKFKPPAQLTLNNVERVSADVTNIKDALQPGHKNDRLAAAVLTCYNGWSDTGPPCTTDPSNKIRRVSTTTVPIN